MTITLLEYLKDRTFERKYIKLWAQNIKRNICTTTNIFFIAVAYFEKTIKADECVGRIYIPSIDFKITKKPIWK